MPLLRAAKFFGVVFLSRCLRAMTGRRAVNPGMAMARMQFAFRTAKFTAVLGAGLVLVGCQSIREAMGLGKNSPDEFTVIAGSPLVIPPEFKLLPPQPGIPARNALDPAQRAFAALFPRSAGVRTARLGNSYSEGELLLLRQAKALNADPNTGPVIGSIVGRGELGPRLAQDIPQRGAIASPPTVNPANAVNAVKAAPAPPDSGNRGEPAKAAPAATPPDRREAAAKAPSSNPSESLLLRRSIER